MKLLLVIAAVVAMGEAHLCLLSPQQRGNITGLDMAGEENNNVSCCCLFLHGIMIPGVCIWFIVCMLCVLHFFFNSCR